MSTLFEAANPTSQTQETPEDTDPYEALVGEGKKFKDNQALAKGKLESDKHIQNLESELSGLREELKNRVSLEKFMDRMEQGIERGEPETTTSTATSQTTITQEDIATTVKQILSTEKDLSSRQANVNFVRSELQKAWGSDFVTVLNEVASELGAKKELEALAESNPKAFLRLVGVAQAPQQQQFKTDTIVPPRSTTTFNNSPAIKEDKAYFDKMRREDPNRYWSAATQSKIHKLAEEGVDFS